jgi:beta-xylosidase
MAAVLLSFSALLLSGIVASQPTRAIDSDFADPCVIQTDDGYYAFGTSANGANVQIAKSSDFSSWELLSGTDAMPGPFPSWVANDPSVWAPDVIKRVNQTNDTLSTDQSSFQLGRRHICHVLLRIDKRGR